MITKLYQNRFNIFIRNKSKILSKKIKSIYYNVMKYFRNKKVIKISDWYK